MPIRKKDCHCDAHTGEKVTGAHRNRGFCLEKGYPFFIFAAHE
jgi:hypothetical protein